MDQLQSRGLRIDEHEKLKILSAEAERGSLELSEKAKLILAGLKDLKRSLDKTSDLIKTLDKQASEVRLANLVYQISQLKRT